MTIKEKIARKLNYPKLFHRGRRLPDACLVWPTKCNPDPRPALRMIRDRQGRPYTVAVSIRPLAKIIVDGKSHYVHRLIHELMNPEPLPFRAVQICLTPFCVNPDHWTFSTISPIHDEPDSLPPPEPDEFPLEDAIDLLDAYLADHPHPPLDPDHNLLIDIPRDLLVQALKLANKEHLIP